MSREATISRRLRDVAHARRTSSRVGWPRPARGPSRRATRRPTGWRAVAPRDHAATCRTTRAWISCLALASHSDAVAEEVLQAWAVERPTTWSSTSTRSAYDDEVPDEVAVAAEILRAVVSASAIRLALDPGSTHERAVGCWRARWLRCSPRPERGRATARVRASRAEGSLRACENFRAGWTGHGLLGCTKVLDRSRRTCGARARVVAFRPAGRPSCRRPVSSRRRRVGSRGPRAARWWGSRTSAGPATCG